MRFGASAVADSDGARVGWDRALGRPDDAMGSLWATEGAFRLLTLAYSLYIHTSAVSHYMQPRLATTLIAAQCIWSGVAAYAMFARQSWRPTLVAVDQLVTLGLVYATWLVAPESWWDHNQSLPTTMWVTNAVLTAGMLAGVWAGFASAVVMGLACLHVGGDLSWLERSPTLPILVSAGLAAGVASHSVRRAHEQLTAALELRARAAERERLARQVHDGVLQVLALTARQGAQAGGEFARVGRLAAQQEQALRHLIAEGDERTRSESSAADLRRALLALEGPRRHVSAGTEAVEMPTEQVEEIVAAVRQALVNTELHGGHDEAAATSFVLLEDLGDEVVVTVRDDGVGMDPARVAQARAEGRLGIGGSIVGRLEALGGRAELVTAPGEGVEWEFTLPR